MAFNRDKLVSELVACVGVVHARRLASKSDEPVVMFYGAGHRVRAHELVAGAAFMKVLLAAPPQTASMYARIFFELDRHFDFALSSGCYLRQQLCWAKGQGIAARRSLTAIKRLLRKSSSSKNKVLNELKDMCRRAREDENEDDDAESEDSVESQVRGLVRGPRPVAK
eukprot:NODE_2618_length_905_cov_2.324706.p1 GENE.NODE_2618_length_905_cov_2.324706~~NODE_2618_length_905_cov_2.324706.p1  ORF type:complete len:168 (+),score=28.17 NODE_2618_length_905_cov_2.324706:162-665(+)